MTAKEWHQAHPDYLKQWRKDNQYKVIQYAEKHRKPHRSKLRDTWDKILKERNMDSCIVCGYNKDTRVLELHHIDPSTKLYQISQRTKQMPNQATLDELDKCISLCPNCHRELHYNIITLP